MANKNMPRGAEPYGRVYRQTPYICEEAKTIYPGDFVKKNSNGTVEPAAAEDRLLGVAMTYAEGGQEVIVLDHPDQYFTIQADDGTVADQTAIGLSGDINAGTPSAKYKRSGMTLDASTLSTTAAQLMVIGLDRSVDNTFGDYAKVVVRINEHQLAEDSAGV